MTTTNYHLDHPKIEPDYKQVNTILENKLIHFVAQKHYGQYRKNADRTPYIVHPLRVVMILWDEAKIRDKSVLQAALLHDTLEDTNMTEEEIKNLCGPKVLKIVKEVTNDPNLSGVQNKQRQIDHAPKMSYEAKLVKLADRLDNVRDLRPPPPAWSSEKVQGYYNWGSKLLKVLQGTHPLIECLLRLEINKNVMT